MKYALIIYPLGFSARDRGIVPEVIELVDIDNIYDANDFAATYTIERFKSPFEFEGCHVVELK